MHCLISIEIDISNEQFSITGEILNNNNEDVLDIGLRNTACGLLALGSSSE
jgi:hypothetical protein